MSELILHIGMHKTGTTSIQASLKQFDNGSVRYAQLCDVNHSIPLYTLFSSERHDYHIHHSRGHSDADIDQMVVDTRADLDKELALGRDRLIVSGEDISLIDPDGVKALAEYLDGKVERVRIIAYVRDPVGYASSALQQRLRGGGKALAVPNPEYRMRFEKYIDCFGESAVEFVSFDECLREGASIVQDFCGRVGIDPSEVEERRANESTTLECARMIYRFNDTGLPASGNMRLVRTRLRFIHQLGQIFPGPSFKIPLECISQCVDWSDVAWMENATGLSLENGVSKLKTRDSQADPVAMIKKELGDITDESVKVLRAEVAKIDTSIASGCDVSTLLNVLYLSLYFDKFANA